MKSKKVRKIGRDAETGKFISVKKAQKSKKTTVVETTRHTGPRKTKKR